MLDTIAWLHDHEYVAVWLEAFALVAIFFWDRLDSRADHQQMLAQLKIAQDQATATKIAAEAAKANADAAKASADAAKSSADMAAQLNRPFVGLSQLLVVSDWRASGAWDVVWALKNFGTLPAIRVDASMDWNTGPGLGGPVSGPHSAELLPQAEMPLKALFGIGMSHDKVLKGQQTLEAHIAITYSSTDGRRYEHSADARWNHETAAFTILNSDTQAR
jgi:orotidine-5'-phosphate decarboxylase